MLQEPSDIELWPPAAYMIVGVHSNTNTQDKEHTHTNNNN